MGIDFLNKIQLVLIAQAEMIVELEDETKKEETLVSDLLLIEEYSFIRRRKD